jgi:hypothetical protein
MMYEQQEVRADVAHLVPATWCYEAYVSSNMSYREQLINPTKITKLEQKTQINGPSSVPENKTCITTAYFIKSLLTFFVPLISCSINFII